MRHAKKNNHLGRTNTHRYAMLSNMASSLIKHKRISTTLAKAKALRVYVEPLITRAKEDTTHSRRVVFGYLQDKDAVTELFRDVSTKIADRPGGYTRILKTGFRQGDDAETCIIELVDYNQNMLDAKESKSKTATTRRSRRGGKKTADAAAAPAAETTTGEVAKPKKAAKPKVEVEEAKVVEEAEIVEEAKVVEEVKDEAPEETAPEAEKTEE